MTRPFHILLVEDDPGDAQLIREMLSETRAGWTVVHAGRLDEAIDRASREPIDAALLDLSLPDAQGAAAFDGLSARFPELPILVLASGSDASALEGIEGRATDRLVKRRFDGQYLSLAIRHAVERRALEERLRQSQKMEAIGRLAGGLAHDFSNLLGVILGSSELVARSALSEADRERVHQMHGAAQRAAALTRQLLTFTGKQVVVPEPLYVGSVVDDLARLFRRVIGDAVELRIQTVREARIYADRGQLEQVLLNLVQNAGDAMPTGGRLTITVTLTSSAGDDAVLIEVADTGIGMTADVQKRMFEPDFTTKRPGESTGLGLATVFGLVEQAGGSIEVASAPGAGSTFRVFLPALIYEPPAPAPPAPARPATILIVEDEPMLRAVIADFCRQEGFLVLEAADGLRALKLFEEHGAVIDVLLSDVVMPGLGGIELLKKVREAHPALPAVLMSGYNDALREAQALPREHLEFLHKPFKGDLLVAKIRAILAEGARR